MANNRLCAPAFGLALGVLWGVTVFIVGLIAHFANYGTEFVSSMGIVYVGGPTILGSLLAGFIGLVDGFIAGSILIWLYNIFANWHCKKAQENTTIETSERID